MSKYIIQIALVDSLSPKIEVLELIEIPANLKEPNRGVAFKAASDKLTICLKHEYNRKEYSKE